MKIIIDARLYGLENAGLGRYVMNLIGQLVNIDKENNYTILLRKKYFEKLRLPNNWRKVEADFRHYGLKEQILLPLYLYREKPDLVHFPHFNIPLFYLRKYVVTIHDLLMHHFKGKETTTRNPLVYFLKRMGYRTVFDTAVKRARKILVPSQTVKDELVKYYHLSSNKVEVTYEGVDPQILNSDINPASLLQQYQIQKPYLIYVGNAYPHKNLDRAISAVKKFNQAKQEQLQLIIVSSRNIFVTRLKKTVVDLHAESDVRILDYIEDDKLGILLENSLGFIYPSLSEGFGLQGLEAMAAGTLVLASDIPVFREIYQDNCLYFNFQDEESIVEKIAEASQMKEDKREALIAKGKNFIKRYSWIKMARETLKVYEESSLGL